MLSPSLQGCHFKNEFKLVRGIQRIASFEQLAALQANWHSVKSLFQQPLKK